MSSDNEYIFFEFGVNEKGIEGCLIGLDIEIDFFNYGNISIL